MDAKTERDPRLNPFRGDRLQAAGSSLCRDVIGKSQQRVTYRSSLGFRTVLIRTWRAWAKTATVIKKDDQ